MKAEIISIGTEILFGEIINTSAAYLARELRRLGFDHYFEQTVDDNPKRIKAALASSEYRSELVIITGGIGPTADGLSKEALAAYLACDLVEDSATLTALSKKAGLPLELLSAEDRKQALYLSGGCPLVNPQGEACGAFISKNGRHYALLPGFPHECRAMFTTSLEPILEDLMGHGPVLSSIYLNFMGLRAADLERKLAPHMARQGEVSHAIYVKSDRNQVRLMVGGRDQTNNEKKLVEVKERILRDLMPYYFGEGETLTLAAALIRQLQASGFNLALAESLTGGLASKSIVDVPGASKVYRGGVNVYTLEAKCGLLGLPRQVLEEAGMVSRECAQMMAAAIRSKLASDFALSFTGVAGPERMENQPVGTVWLGLATPVEVKTQCLHLGEDMSRAVIRKHAVNTAFSWLWQMLKQAPQGEQVTIL